MKRKIFSSLWFLAAIIMVTAEPQTNRAMILYLPLMANFLMAGLYARKTFKTSENGH